MLSMLKIYSCSGALKAVLPPPAAGPVLRGVCLLPSPPSVSAAFTKPLPPVLRILHEAGRN